MLPDVPTAAEAGLPDFRSALPLESSRQPALPSLQRLTHELSKVLLLPDVKEKLLQQGAFVTHTTPEQAAQLIRSEVAMWAKAIREGNVKVE